MAAEQDIIERTVVERRDPLLGEVFDRRFRVEARVAAGGFGAIYRATHLKSGHEFALKVLHPNLTNDPGVVARFRREGAALTLLRDPHTITAYELGEADDGTLYIVMELLRGESLHERYRTRGRLRWQHVVAIARAVCSSLAEAHALGIIHRDLKPTNIHLEPRGNERDFVKVLDFGIAKILQDSDIDSSDLTQAGQMIGTLDYMSPEQMVGGMCGPTSDIYTLGIVMYEMIAGEKPFSNANSAAAALAAVLTMTPPRLSTRAIVTPDVDRVVMRCLERQHTDRFQSAVELATALDEILPGVDEVVTRVGAGTPKVVPGIPAAVDRDAPIVDPDAVTLDPAATDSDTVNVAPSLIADLNAAPAAGARPVVRTVPAASKVMPASKPASVIVKPAPAASNLTPVPKAAPAVRKSAPIDYDSTLIGRPSSDRLPADHFPADHFPADHFPADHAPADYAPADRAPADRAPADRAPADRAPADRAPAVRSQQTSAPLAGPPLVLKKNLRETYPTIHRPAPSPLRPPVPPFDDRPASTTGTMAPFDMERTVRRDAIFRRLALGIGIGIAIILTLLIASRL